MAKSELVKHDFSSVLRGQAQRTAPADIPFDELQSTPAYLIDGPALEDNLRRLRAFADVSGARILLAQKAYSTYQTYELIGSYLDGTCSSGLYEAQLAYEAMPEGEIEVFSPGYKPEDFPELFRIADTLIFNSFAQLESYRAWRRKKVGVRARDKQTAEPRLGLRINPEISSVETEIYNPSAPFSRLGLTLDNFKAGAERYGLDDISGLHFHVLCEENSDALERSWEVVRENFAPWLRQMSWVNMGGGHHLTRRDYDIHRALDVIEDAQAQFDLEVYLEPGEAIALDAGYLVTEVLDTFTNGMPLAILDTSAVCHMPDVLEMPYRPRAFVLNDASSSHPKAYALAAEHGPHLTRLGGPTCLAGDIVGDYDFGRALQAGDRIVFCDMAIYTMVKTNTFNGMPLPGIVLWDGTELKTLRDFSYRDFKMRLGS